MKTAPQSSARADARQTYDNRRKETIHLLAMIGNVRPGLFSGHSGTFSGFLHRPECLGKPVLEISGRATHRHLKKTSLPQSRPDKEIMEWERFLEVRGLSRASLGMGSAVCLSLVAEARMVVVLFYAGENTGFSIEKIAMEAVINETKGSKILLLIFVNVYTVT